MNKEEILEMNRTLNKFEQDYWKIKNNWKELKEWLSELLKDRICDELYYEALLDTNIKIKEIESRK